MQPLNPAQLAAAAAVVYWASADDALATSLCVAGVVLMLGLAEIVKGPNTALAVGFAVASWIGAAVVAGVVDDSYGRGSSIAVVVVTGLAAAVALWRVGRGIRYNTTQD